MSAFKLFPKALSALLILCLVGTSCEDQKDTKIGKVSFSFTQSTTTLGRQMQTAHSILVSIKNVSGTLIEDKKELSLFNFEGEYLSEPLALKIGSYTLVEFIVVGSDNQVLYVTPIEDSELAYLVDMPLPIPFEVTEDSVTKVNPKVISAQGNTALDFGYTTFTFNIVNTLSFLSAAFIHNAVDNTLELTNHQLIVHSGTDTLYSGFLNNSTHRIIVKSNFTNYTLSYLKDGYIKIVKSLSKQDLESYESVAMTTTLLSQDLSSGLVAYYPFNGNANDGTSNNSHGIVNGATLTTDRKNVAAAAYSFDGNDFIEIPNSNPINFGYNDDFTISFWALVPENQNDLSATGNELLSKWDAQLTSSYPYSIRYLNKNSTVSNKHKISLLRFDSQACGNNPSITGSSTLTLENWNHIALVKQGNQLYYYQNEVLIGQTTDNTVQTCDTKNNLPLMIGKRSPSLYHFTGKIDDIRIYNRPLTAAEISELKNE